MLRERIMLGLRLSEGIDVEGAAKDLGIEGHGWTQERTRAAKRLEQRGRVEREGARLRIPRVAWLWTDDTAASLM
jgi:coproporphyrinogen III oxidase-like Fe-S oxidoreductase